jgi:hypothetical protein
LVTHYILLKKNKKKTKKKQKKQKKKTKKKQKKKKKKKEQHRPRASTDHEQHRPKKNEHKKIQQTKEFRSCVEFFQIWNQQSNILPNSKMNNFEQNSTIGRHNFERNSLNEGINHIEEQKYSNSKINNQQSTIKLNN